MVAAARVRVPGGALVPLRDGQPLSFGRSGPAPAADLLVGPSSRVSRRAGVLESTPYGVLLTNTGSNPLLVDEPGAPGRTLRPRQAHLLTAAGRTRVGFAGTEVVVDVDVPAGLAAGLAGIGGTGDPAGEATADRTRPAWSLAENTAYFGCLVALCEPTLRHPESPWIPTSQQVADRLWAAGLLPEPRSADWVDRRLDDVRAKLPVGEKGWSAERARQAGPGEQSDAVARERSGAPRRSGRKEQLVEFAVGYGLVTLDTVRRLLG